MMKRFLKRLSYGVHTMDTRLLIRLALKSLFIQEKNPEISS